MNKNIKGIDKHIITLIVDFLQYIRYRVSKIIHIHDKDIKFQKEILYEYIGRPPAVNDNEDSIPLKDVSALIFQSDTKKEKKISEKRKNRYQEIDNMVKEQIKQNDEEEEGEGEEDEEEGEEEEESNSEKEQKRIK